MMAVNSFPHIVERLMLNLFIDSKFLKALFVVFVIASNAAAAEKGVFRAGAAKVDITPALGVSLDGPISKNGVVSGVNDPLHARALVLDDGQNRLAIVVCDTCMISRDVVDAAKLQISENSGIAIERILIAGTHTHATPRLTHVGTTPLDDEYHKLVSNRIAEAVQTAENNLAPASIGYGSFNRPDLIACRRFLCEPGSVEPNPFGETGERIKSVAGKSSAVIEPAGPVDPQFSILSVRHTDGHPLAILGNFSVHYCGGYQRGIVSADYFGQYAQALETAFSKETDHPPFIGLMSNGTSGNTGAIRSDGRKYKPYEWLTLAGRMLAQETIASLKKIDHRTDVDLEMQQRDLSLSVRRPDQARIDWAKALLNNLDQPQPHRWAKVYAQETLHLSQYPLAMPIMLQAIRIGDIGIAAAPCEVFAETGLKIKEQSPLKQTFTIELANGYGGYLPPAEQHALGGYETWPARSSFLEVEAEAKIRQGLLKLLTQVAQGARP